MNAEATGETGEERRQRYALDFVHRLEEHFQAEFDHEHLNAVWPKILACQPKALGVAVWLAKKQHKKLPSVPQLVQMVEFQQRRLFPPPVVAEELQPVKMPEECRERLQQLGLW